MAGALLDKIIEKTIDNKSIKGNKFKKYSKAYMESAAFKKAGKTSKVNLTLSGDMLALVEAVGETANTITLGWSDTKQGGKAHGHITGGGRNNSLPVRDFFGLNAKDIAAVKGKFKSEIDAIKSARGSGKDKAIDSFITKLDEDDG